MKQPERNRIPSILLVAFLFSAIAAQTVAAQTVAAAAGAAAAEHSLSGVGFDISIEELFESLSFQRSARLDSLAKIEADWSPRFEKLAVRDLEKSENRYVYAVDPQRKRQIIAIRGTANLANALLDLESWKDKSPELGIKLHHGFEKAAKLVFEDVQSLLDPNVPILICGHSLGAAEAIIVGMLLVKHGYQVQKIIASGPPKVTDIEGLPAVRTLPVVLVTAAFDPVPFLPPASLYPKKPFVQSGSLLMLLDGPYMTIAPPEYYEAMGTAYREVKQLSEHFDVVDHRVWTYCDRAGEKLKEFEFVPFADWMIHAAPRK